MPKMSVIDRLTERQAVTLSHMRLDIDPVETIVSLLDYLNEILTEYEDHDLCYMPDYKRYYRVFRQNVKSLMVLSRCSAFILDK
jgi:hypothetical protein